MKSFIVTLMMVMGLVAWCGSPAPAAVLVFSPNGMYVAKTDIYTANTAADAAGKTVVVTTAQSLTANITLATDRAWKFEKGAVITTTGYTLNANNASVEIGNYQAFSGTGTVANLQKAYPEWFGAKGDGTSDDTLAIQSAINSASLVYFSDKTYMCGNILIKTGLRLIGTSQSATLKLLPNATTYSINGSQPDSNGRYPGNILCSTLNHDGGTWSDGGVRAKDENNSSYIYENVIIENLTLDGNKALNQVGDLGANASAMGAGVSIHQCKGVTVRNCKIINNRMDGIHVGYTLHGGSDYNTISGNHFEGNQRTNIALITGKYNVIAYNTGTAPTGGTEVNAGSALDIEANFDDEVNYRHTVIGNRLGGGLGIVSVGVAKLQDTKMSGNVWQGGLWLGDPTITQGVSIVGDSFVSTSTGSDWLTRYGANAGSINVRPVQIHSCSVSGFGRVMAPLTQGQSSNLDIADSSFKTQSFGQLVRGYQITFRNNTFNFSGNTDGYTIQLSNTLGGTVPNQGRINFHNNTFYGVSNASFFNLTRDTTWPMNSSDFIFQYNTVAVSGHTQLFVTPSSMTIRNNRITGFSPISITSLNYFKFVGNEVSSAAAQNMFADQTSAFSDVEISNNDFNAITINLLRPKDTTIINNRLVDGYISIVYSYTSSGVGGNHVGFNTMTAKSVLANPFTVTTGTGFLTGDFVRHDRYKYNIYVGYTGGASIAADMAGVYDGTFD